MSAQSDALNRYTTQLASAARRVNQLALDNARQLFGVQLHALEHTTRATTGFFGELADARTPPDLPALLAGCQQLARDNFERLASANQEMVGLGLQTGAALGELVAQPFHPDTAARTTG